MFYWLVTLASLVGVWLNIHRYRACFAIWAVTNASWAVIDLKHGLPAQATLQTIYFLLSLYGLARWSRDRGRFTEDPLTSQKHPTTGEPA